MMRTRLLPTILAIILCFSLIGCGETANTGTVPEQLPNGYVRGKVISDNGSMTTAGIIAEDSEGGRYRYTTNYLSGYELSLKPGKYTLYFTKGAEYSVVKTDVEVESLKPIYLNDIRLVRLYDSYAKGMIGGDLHQHTYYSDGYDSVDSVLLSNISNGLYYGFLSDHNSARGLAEWAQGNRFTVDIDNDGSMRNFNGFEAVEVTTEYGHYQSLGVGLTFDQYEVVLKESERSKPKAEKDEIIRQKIKYIGETITREGGLAQINHPYSSGTMGFNYWEVADYFDTIEIWNGVYVPGDGRYESEVVTNQTQNYKAKLKWFELLNGVKEGEKFHAATGGTDNHEVASTYEGAKDGEIITIADYEKAYARNGKYSGVPTTYTLIDGEITLDKTLNALRKGNSFITNAPIVSAKVGDKSFGDSVNATDGKIELNMEIFNREGFEGIKIIKNGETVQTLLSDTSLFINTLTLAVNSGDWIVLEVLGTGTQYAITNPIFIE